MQCGVGQRCAEQAIGCVCPEGVSFLVLPEPVLVFSIDLSFGFEFLGF